MPKVLAMPDLSASRGLARLDLSDFYPADPLLWVGFAALALGTTALCQAQGITVQGESAKYFIGLALLVAGCLTRGVFPRETSIATLLETMAAFIIFPAIFAPLSYVASRSPFPAIDLTLRAADLVTGFDAVRWHDVIASSPALRWINLVAYESLIPQGLIAILILPRVGNGLQGFTMLRASTLVLLLIEVIAYLIPAIGTIPTSEAWYPDWLALRQLDVPFQIKADHLQGIISFPSFHAAMGLILAYSLRGMGMFSWLAAALNGLMIIATPAGGYHYLTDVVAGLVVAAGGIAVVRYAEQRGAAPRSLS